MAATQQKRKPLGDPLTKDGMHEVEDAAGLPTTDAIDYAADAGAGMEGADRDSFAIPFLAVLQTNSPQCEAIEGAKPGMLINTVTNKLYTEALIIPCAYQRRWVRWGAREAGGGFKGEMTTAEANALRAAGQVKELENRLYFPEPDGSINPKRSDRLSDTRNHYVLIIPELTPDALGVAAVFALTSTGIRVSKNFMSRIDAQKITVDGKAMSVASFAFAYRVKTVKRSNDMGTWYTPEIEPAGKVPPALYAQARAFHAQVVAGRVTAAHETATPEGDEASAGGNEAF